MLPCVYGGLCATSQYSQRFWTPVTDTLYKSNMSEVSSKQEGCGGSEIWMNGYLCITIECLPQVEI